MRPTPEPSENLLGERIRNRREARGLAAYALAARVGISPSYLSLIESGSKVPSDEIAARIAMALDDDFLAGLVKLDADLRGETLLEFALGAFDSHGMVRDGDFYAGGDCDGEFADAGHFRGQGSGVRGQSSRLSEQ